MNIFAIEEADQFEIHVKDRVYVSVEALYNVAKEVMLEAQKGSDYYRL